MAIWTAVGLMWLRRRLRRWFRRGLKRWGWVSIDGGREIMDELIDIDEVVGKFYDVAPLKTRSFSKPLAELQIMTGKKKVKQEDNDRDVFIKFKGEIDPFSYKFHKLKQFKIPVIDGFLKKRLGYVNTSPIILDDITHRVFAIICTYCEFKVEGRLDFILASAKQNMQEDDVAAFTEVFMGARQLKIGFLEEKLLGVLSDQSVSNRNVLDASRTDVNDEAGVWIQFTDFAAFLYPLTYLLRLNLAQINVAINQRNVFNHKRPLKLSVSYSQFNVISSYCIHKDLGTLDEFFRDWADSEMLEIYTAADYFNLHDLMLKCKSKADFVSGEKDGKKPTEDHDNEEQDGGEEQVGKAEQDGGAGQDGGERHAERWTLEKEFGFLRSMGWQPPDNDEVNPLP